MAIDNTDDLNVQSEYLADLVEEETNKRVKDIDKLSASISKMEKNNKKYAPNKMQKDIGSIQFSVDEVKDDIGDIRDDIEELNTEGIEDIEKSTNKILSKIGYTIDSLARGVTRITKNTALATKDAVAQYGRAISEDISFNKQNVVAMSLARSTPLFGYFASKFMETDVFKNAYANIKEKLGNAVSSGWEKVKSFFKRKPKEINAEEAIGSRAVRATEEAEMEYADIEGGAAEESIEEKAKKTKKAEKESEIEKKALESVSEKAEKAKQEAPKLQAGGYVEKEGLTRVHAAEVVLPIEKVLAEIDKASGSKEIMASMGQNISIMTEAMAGTERYLEQVHHERETIIETFTRSFKQFGRTESWQDKMLRATLTMQANLVGATNRMQAAWEQTLLQHPTLRNLVAFSQVFKETFAFPLRFLFSARGGYKEDVRKATRSKNVFENIGNVLGLIYSTGMLKLDNISKYLKELTEYTTGKEISPVQEKTWTMFEKIKEYMTSPKKETNFLQAAFEKLVDEMELDRKVMAEAGVTGFGSFMKPGSLLGKMGVTRESVSEKFPMMGKLPFMGRKEKTTEDNIASMASDIKEFKEQSKKSSKMSITLDKEQLNTLNKNKKGTEAVGEKVGGLTSHMKKAGKSLWKWLLIGFTLVKDTFSFIGGKIIMLLGVAATALKWLAAKSGITGLAAKGFGAAKAGIMGLGSKAATLGAGIGTAGAVAGVGGAIWSIADMIKGVGKAKEWGTGKAAAGIGGMLGGTDEGFSLKGTAKGMAKGGMVGAGIGTMVAGPIGTVIGGAIGTIAGGLLGFIGGKNIAKALTVALKGLKLLAKGIWKLIKFPFIAMGWLAKKALKGMWWTVKKMFKGGWWATKKIMSGVWKIVSFPATVMKWLVKDVVDAVKVLLPDKVKEKIKVVSDSVMSIFNWVFNLFEKAKEWIKEKILSIPGVGRVLKFFGVGKEKPKETIEGKAENVVKTEAEPQESLFERLRRQFSDEALKLVIPPEKYKGSPNALLKNISIMEKEGLITRVGDKWYSAREARNLLNARTIEEKAADISTGNEPSAQEGGYVTKTGKINVHAGEIIGPIEKVGEVINKTNLANMAISGDLIKEKARMKSEDELRKELTENNKNQNKMNNVVMNMTNMMSHSMRSVSSGTNIGGMSGQDSGSGYVSMVVNGNIE